MVNTNHWYDGWIYDNFIAPNQDASFRLVASLIEQGTSVLDVGTGTGRLLLQLAHKSIRIDGIDPSKRNVEIAKENMKRHPLPLPQVSVYHAKIEDFFHDHDVSYDYAVLSYVLHEIGADKRESILTELSAHARKIIAVDYAWPQPHLLLRAFNEAVEFAAGRSHYRNFKSYMANRGLNGLAERTGLTVMHEVRNRPPGSHIVVLTGQPCK